MLLSFEIPNREEPLLFELQGPRCCTVWSGVSSPAGVGLEHVQTDIGSPGTWELLSFPRQQPGRRYRVNNSRPRRRTRPARSESNECNRGTIERGNEARWMGGRRQSVLIVPMKLANFTPLEPVEGSETSIHGTFLEKHDECIEIRQPCPRNRNG